MGQFKRATNGSARWLIGFTLLLLFVVGAAPVIADPAPEGQGATTKWDPELDPSLLPDATDLAKAEEQIEEREAERAQELESPAAIAEREESTLAFKDLESAGAVSDLLRSSFENVLAILDQDPARVLSDGSLKRNLHNDGGAVISDEGATELIEAEIPAEIPTENGDLEKVDLSLDVTAEGFEPENPITEIAIPTSPAEAISIEDGAVSITQVGADPESSAHLFGDKDVIYPEVQTDTDLLVSPRSNGVELFDQLRSSQSPETLHFSLSLPEGAELRANAGAAEAYEGEKLIGLVSPPHAVDAQGTRVPVTMDVQGSSLLLSVPHRDAEYAYPILVDPEYTQNDWVNISWVAGNRYDVLTDGTFLANWNNSKILTKDTCINACWGSGHGLHVSVPSGNYNGGQWAQWTYTPPGETSYLSGYLVNPFWRYDAANQACWSNKHPEPHDFDGLWSPTYGIFYQLYTNRALYGNVAAIYGNTAQTAKVMIIGMSTGGGSSDPCWRDLYAGGVATYMTDPENPTLDPISGKPSGWFDDSKQLGINVSAHDPGLGVSNVTLNIEGSPQVTLKPSPCYGTHDSPCPRDMSGTIPFNGDNFDEGLSWTYAVASDALSRPSAGQGFWAYVDSTGPEVSLSGQLAAATEETEGDSKDPKKWDDLSLSTYNLTVKAKDGSATNNKTRRSGTKDIEIWLDGTEQTVPWSPKGSPCENCEMTQTYQLKLDGLAAGKHTLKAIGVDQMDHKSEREIEFEYIPATGMKDEYVMQRFPLPNGQGNEAEEEHPKRPELAVNVMNGNLVYREKDVDVPGYAADLEVERFYNSQLPNSENTEWGDGWTLAQTPELEPEAGAAPKEAELVDTSGALEGEVKLPTEVGKTQFNPALRATVTKEVGGGYELADKSGETDTAIAFDTSGRTDELRTESYARIDYSYAAGKLDEIAIKDPGSAGDLSPAEEEALEYVPPAPTYTSVFGGLGTGNGQFVTPTDVAMAANGDLWVVDRGYHRVQRFNESGAYISKFGSNGTGNGQFKNPSSIAIDSSGNLWVADAGNNRIQKFNSNGEFLKAVGSLGSGNGQFAAPEGIATDSKGNVYVADAGNQRIQKFNANGEFLAKFGSYGNGNGQFWRVNSVDVGPGGKIWASDPELRRVTQFNEAGEFVQKFGSAGTGSGQFGQPAGIEVDSRGNVWVADISNNRVQQFSQAGTYLTQFGTKGTGAGQFMFQAGTQTVGIISDSKGGLWITDAQNARIQKWGVPNYRPSYQSFFGTNGTGDGQLKSPGDIAVDEGGNLWVVDRANNRIQKFDQAGKFIAKYGTLGSGNGQFNRPTSIAIDASGNIWVADANNNRIQKFDDEGQFMAKYGTYGSGNGQFNDPEGIAADFKGNIYVAEAYNSRVQVFNEEGAFVQKFGSYGTGPGQFGEANALDIGPKGEVWVADWVNNRVSQFTENGAFVSMFGSTGAGNGQFNHPDAVEVDTKGNIWVGDQSNNRVQLFNKVGEYITQFGSTGSGAGQFSFTYPMGIAAEPDGDLWITDVNNNRVQKWQVPSTEPPKPAEENDPSVEVGLSSNLVSSVEGDEAGLNTYAHTGELLTANKGPDGETKYEYDAQSRLKKVTLPNGTYGSITYNTTYGRVSKVTVDPAGSEPAKSTGFAYSDEPRRTTVTPEGAPITTYDIGADGSVLKWQDVKKPPTIENISGSLYVSKGKEVNTGVQNLVVKASSPQGISTIQIVANGTDLVDEKTCTENIETEVVECSPLTNEWVMETENFSPGTLNLEAIVEDGAEEVASERFWVNIPLPPPPAPDGLPVKPKFKDIVSFREEFGLEVWDPVNDETELNDRVYDLINAWTVGDPVARASWERWGAPLRSSDVAELDYRQQYQEQAAIAIPAWVQAHANSTYAGYYIDEKAGGIIYVGFTGNQEEQKEQISVLQAGAGLMAPSRVAGFTAPPTQSLSQLEGLQNAINGSSSPAITKVGIDVKSNRVLVGSSNVSQTTSQLTSELGAGAAFSVYYEPSGLVPRSPRERNVGSVIAGDSLTSPYFGSLACTAGYGAWENSPPKPSGEVVRRLFLLDVAHCFLEGEKAERRDGITHVRKVVGMTARDAYDYFGNGHSVNGWSTDASAIRVDSAELAPRQIWRYPLNATDVRLAAPVPGAGTWVCFSGQTSDKVICGPITVSEKVVFSFPGGTIGNQKMWLTCFKEPSIGGDSGGPVWIKGTHKAIGLVSAGDKDETCLTPLLPVQGHPQAPGVLAAPGMGSLNLMTKP